MREWQSLSHVRWECNYHSDHAEIPTVALDEERIRKYIRDREKLESRQGDLDLA